ncbi:2',3'-cyclic-nucleotide 3'-phosphodiesterase [Sphaeramia orbicularis]|uniref:2',3'-cyclic-nucleotide 3'-phosphodiesterase n=1 Tax=Sphaeramia orbicularis TaxID=375764 RepID=A0A673BMA6_9TELE|nr:2',3'-cyclic-nucleotide 3'-phosphodiesterase [Sphaeramia orbicularis]
MDTEMSGELVQTPLQEEIAMEKEVASKLETQEEAAEPEKPPAAAEEADQFAVNGHTETQELVVTQTVMVSEENMETKTEALPEDKSEMETGSDAVAPPEPDESSEKLSDSDAALGKEPESAQPVPENKPEPVAMQTPLADSAPVPEPDKPAETVPEAAQSDGTLPEPATLQQPADTQALSQEENLTGQEEAMEKLKIDTEAEEDRKMTETVTVEPAKKEEEKQTEAGMSKEETSEKEAEVVKPAEDVKEVKPEASDAEAGAEGVKPEQNEPESKKEEVVVPSPGSLSFALLEHSLTKETLRTSATLIILRGLPGSGKSHLARAIGDAYKDHCTVICADDHGVKPENPESSADGYKALDEAVLACCSGSMPSSVLIVVDDTNHTQDRLARLAEIALEHHRVPVFLEPRTEWSRDAAQLSKKSRRGLEEAQINAMKGPLEEMTLPLYFGWFLVSAVQDNVRCTAMDFLKTLDTLEVFKKHLNEFTGKAEKEVDLEQYFKAKGTLHCTTKFCDYGKANGAKEYAEKQAVTDFYGSAFELSLSALFVTPRTVGARVSLTEEQLLLWPDDAEKEAESVVPAAASLPLGSRAHVTLGCAEGVEAVQTGFDLLEILALQQAGQQGEVAEEMELGTLAYFGEGRWLLSLREPMRIPAFFSSFYGRKESEPTKKEPEKKKKPKCTIL